MNFIHQEFIPTISLCDELIAFYNANPKYWIEGTTGDTVNRDRKKSTDLILPVSAYYESELFKRYLTELGTISKNYIDKFNFCNDGSSWGLAENFNIQYYKPGEAFFAWHCERITSKIPYSNRHLVWMTYLNDVTDEGETEFYYQELKIKPEKGKTVIFPADWTHTHRGIASKTQDKYIITGWYNFL